MVSSLSSNRSIPSDIGEIASDSPSNHPDISSSLNLEVNICGRQGTSGDLMHNLRNDMSQAAAETTSLRRQFDDIGLQLNENLGDSLSLLHQLPTVHSTSFTSQFNIMEELDALLVGANVLSQSSTKDNDHEELHQSNGSESEEDGFEIATRGGLRDTADLEKNGLEPVWTTWKGYPGHIPGKIAEYLDDNGDVSGIQLIGPIKSLFWLGGYDDVVEAIDDPAFVIEDEIQFVPLGATVGYLVVRYFEQGKLPAYMMRRELWYDAPFLGDQTNFNAFPARVNIIPRSITNDPRTDTLQSLYPLSRPQCLPQAVQCFRVKAEKHIDRQMRKIRSLTPNIFDTENLWFRGLTLAALTCTLAFFIPAMATRTHDNEFGPGFYTTNDFPYALAYSTSTGAVMVFKNPDLRGLKVWEPTIDQWNQLTATWTLSPPSGVNDMFPLEYKDADFIRGPISELGEKGKLRKRSDKDQLVAVSYKGCAVLSASLHTIIYIEP